MSKLRELMQLISIDIVNSITDVAGVDRMLDLLLQGTELNTIIFEQMPTIYNRNHAHLKRAFIALLDRVTLIKQGNAQETLLMTSELRHGKVLNESRERLVATPCTPENQVVYSTFLHDYQRFRDMWQFKDALNSKLTPEEEAQNNKVMALVNVVHNALCGETKLLSSHQKKIPEATKTEQEEELPTTSPYSPSCSHYTPSRTLSARETVLAAKHLAEDEAVISATIRQKTEKVETLQAMDRTSVTDLKTRFEQKTASKPGSSTPRVFRFKRPVKEPFILPINKAIFPSSTPPPPPPPPPKQ